MIRCTVFCWLGLMVAATAGAQTDYDFLLKGGHVIDGKNGISAVRDVAIKDGKIAAVTTNIPAARALKTIDATGLYVTPGLFDMHVHVYHGEIPNGYAKGDRSFNPDGFTLRSCVTTVTDAGSAGWRNFDDFKSRIIDNAKTRAFAARFPGGVTVTEYAGAHHTLEFEPPGHPWVGDVLRWLEGLL